jgi:hypothetical protein
MAAVGTGSIGVHARIHHPLRVKRYAERGWPAMILVNGGSNNQLCLSPPLRLLPQERLWGRVE